LFLAYQLHRSSEPKTELDMGHTPALDHSLDRKIGFRNHQTELRWGHDYKVI